MVQIVDVNGHRGGGGGGSGGWGSVNESWLTSLFGECHHTHNNSHFATEGGVVDGPRLASDTCTRSFGVITPPHILHTTFDCI